MYTRHIFYIPRSFFFNLSTPPSQKEPQITNRYHQMAQPPTGPRFPNTDGRYSNPQVSTRPSLPPEYQSPSLASGSRKHDRDTDEGDVPAFSSRRRTTLNGAHATGYSHNPTTRRELMPHVASRLRHEIRAEDIRSPSTQPPILDLPLRSNADVRPGEAQPIPSRGIPVITGLAMGYAVSDDSTHPPLHDPTVVNAATVDLRDLPNGLRRSDGPRCTAANFFPGGIFRAPHHATALQTDANPRTNKNFVQSHISIACCKLRLYFTDYAHDEEGLQAYPLFTHTGKGLSSIPPHLWKYHIPVINWDDEDYINEHPNYHPVRARMYSGRPIKPNTYIDISMSYPINFKEDINAVGLASESTTGYVVEKVDALAKHAREKTAHYASRHRASVRRGRSRI